VDHQRMALALEGRFIDNDGMPTPEPPPAGGSSGVGGAEMSSGGQLLTGGSDGATGGSTASGEPSMGGTMEWPGSGGMGVESTGGSDVTGGAAVDSVSDSSGCSCRVAAPGVHRFAPLAYSLALVSLGFARRR